MITLITVITTILLTGFFAGVETGCYTLSRLKLFHAVYVGDKNAVILKNLVDEPQKYVFMTLICQNIFVYLTSALVTNYYLKTEVVGENMIYLWNFFPWSAEVAATVSLIFPLFIFAEVGPKNLFLGYADTLMYKTVKLQKICFVICKPLVFIIRLLADMLPSSKESGYYNFDEMNIHKLKLFFTESQHEGVITGHQNEMINNTIRLHETKVSNIMIPMNKLFSLSVDSSSAVWISSMRKRKNNYSDIPVYFKNKKKVLGTVNFFDVINAVERKYENLRESVKRLIKLNVNIDIQQAFYEMQVKKENKALIVDRKGLIVGMVYLKDIVAYITKKGSVI
jgi:putative hemolysin